MALDVYRSYFFFCLSAKVPALCLAVSSISLMMFLLSVSYNAWPAAVLVMCFFAGVLLSLQYIVFGAEWVGRRVLGGMRAVARGALRCWEKLGQRTGGLVRSEGKETKQASTNECVQVYQ